MRNRRKGLKIAHWNITSLKKHKVEVEAFMHDHQLDILGLNETILNQQIENESMNDIWELMVMSYDIYRNDRDASVDGVALYVNSFLPYHQRDDITDPQLEILGA